MFLGGSKYALRSCKRVCLCLSQWFDLSSMKFVIGVHWKNFKKNYQILKASLSLSVIFCSIPLKNYITATIEKVVQSIDWSLKKVFVREELDLFTHSREFFLLWKRQFKNFIRESGIKAVEISWETKMAAIEACVTSATFEKITAAQLQLPCEQRQNINALLDVIATIAKAKDNVWVYRKAFDAYKQQTDQMFKQLYAESYETYVYV